MRPVSMTLANILIAVPKGFPNDKAATGAVAALIA
jgi:hypothetical protein